MSKIDLVEGKVDKDFCELLKRNRYKFVASPHIQGDVVE